MTISIIRVLLAGLARSRNSANSLGGAPSPSSQAPALEPLSNPSPKKTSVCRPDGPSRLLAKLHSLAERPVGTVDRGVHTGVGGLLTTSQGALAKILGTGKTNVHRWLKMLQARGSIELRTEMAATTIRVVSTTADVDRLTDDKR